MTKETILNELRDTDFQPHVNSVFTAITDSGNTTEFKLQEVTAIGSESDNHSRRAFSLVFLSKNVHTPQQSIYELEHPQLGQLDIFLVPIGPDHQGMRYEAVFT